MKKYFVLLVLGFQPMWLLAQDSDLGNWIQYFGNKHVGERWNIHNEIQYRNYNAIGDLEQLLLRTGLGYQVSAESNLLLGYGFIRSENYLGESHEKFTTNEHRIFQQYIVKHHVSLIAVQHRFRLEERFVEGDFSMRGRYFLALNVGLNNREIIENTFYISVYNEIFLNFQSETFDRDRVYAGLGYKVNGNLKFEMGYMNQVFGDSERDQLNMMAFVNF